MSDSAAASMDSLAFDDDMPIDPHEVAKAVRLLAAAKEHELPLTMEDVIARLGHDKAGLVVDCLRGAKDGLFNFLDGEFHGLTRRARTSQAEAVLTREEQGLESERQGNEDLEGWIDSIPTAEQSSIRLAKTGAGPDKVRTWSLTYAEGGNLFPLNSVLSVEENILAKLPEEVASALRARDAFWNQYGAETATALEMLREEHFVSEPITADSPLTVELEYLQALGEGDVEFLRALSKNAKVSLVKINTTPDHVIEAIGEVARSSQGTFVSPWLTKMIKENILPISTEADKENRERRFKEVYEAALLKAEIVGEQDQFRGALLKALAEEGKEVPDFDAAVQCIQEIQPLYMHIQTEGALTEEEIVRVNAINEKLQGELGKAYTLSRMMLDYSNATTEGAQKLIKALLVIGPLTHLLEHAFPGAAAEIFAGVTDDSLAGMAEASALTEAGIPKAKILAQMKWVFAALGVAFASAGYVDQAKEISDHLAGSLFCFSAVTVSLTLALSSVSILKKSQDNIAREGKAPDCFPVLEEATTKRLLTPEVIQEIASLNPDEAKKKIWEVLKPALDEKFTRTLNRDAGARARFLQTVEENHIPGYQGHDYKAAGLLAAAALYTDEKADDDIELNLLWGPEEDKALEAKLSQRKNAAFISTDEIWGDISVVLEEKETAMKANYLLEKEALFNRFSQGRTVEETLEGLAPLSFTESTRTAFREAVYGNYARLGLISGAALSPIIGGALGPWFINQPVLLGVAGSFEALMAAGVMTYFLKTADFRWDRQAQGIVSATRSTAVQPR